MDGCTCRKTGIVPFVCLHTAAFIRIFRTYVICSRTKPLFFKTLKWNHS